MNPVSPFRSLFHTTLATIATLGIVSTPSRAPAAEPPSEDREAILAMAGEYEVLFNFEETVALQEDYKLKDPYQETATEMVVVVEKKPERIVLQHILSVGSGKRVVKHWKQIWTWEDTRIVDYQGRDEWEVRELEPETVEGTWSQLVTQVDDSPRYESYGEWKHDGGYSRWTSGVTARPLPRREYTKRDDYQILQTINRHSITPHGWVHGQDSVKQVLGEEGEVDRYIARERGVNYYDRTDSADFTKARNYWKSTRDFWATVSEVWKEVENERDHFAIVEKVDGESLTEEMSAIAKDMVKDDEPAPAEGEIESTIRKYVN